MQVEELGIESSPMWPVNAPVGALIPQNQVTNFSIYNNSITQIGKYK